VNKTRKELYEIEAIFAENLDNWYLKTKETLKDSAQNELGFRKEMIKSELDVSFSRLATMLDPTQNAGKVYAACTNCGSQKETGWSNSEDVYLKTLCEDCRGNCFNDKKT